MFFYYLGLVFIVKHSVHLCGMHNRKFCCIL